MTPIYRTLTSFELGSSSGMIPGVQSNTVQTGVGVGPNVTQALLFDNATLFANSFGFPVRGQTALSNDWIVAALVSSAPSGTRWCGYDLEPGSTLLYGPGAEHVGIHPAGVEYTAAIVPIRSIEEIADELQMRIRIPQRGSVGVFHPSSSQGSVGSVLDCMDLAATSNEGSLSLLRGVNHALASELAEEPGVHRPERMSVRESRRIVRSCLEFVNDAGGSPSIAALCGVAFVSERRLRNAFVAAFGVPPMQYFRFQKLNEARRRLLAASNHLSVTDISIDVGIENGGRFARGYFDLFGELPSTTLQRTD